MSLATDLGRLLHYGGFRQLLAVRLTSQSSDGVFQASLATSLLFNPERAPSATAIAAGFAVLLLPFSVLGPFAGVLLDRWNRRTVLVSTNILRSGLLLGLALAHSLGLPPSADVIPVLAVLGLNRFLLSGLSASLPHVVPRDQLLTANSITPTCGTIAYVVGLLAGGTITGLGATWAPFVVAAVGYAAAALVARRMPHLGPDLEAADASVRVAVRGVISAIADASANLPRTAAIGLGLMAAIRFPVGVMIVSMILFFRATGGSGLVGFGTAVAAAGVGLASAAVVTPLVTKRVGLVRAMRIFTTVSAAAQLLAIGYRPVLLATSAFVLGVCTQGVKVCVDTVIQRDVPDVYRGRVFSLYDILYNVAFVSATALAAAILPPGGASLVAVLGAALAYVAMSLTLARTWPESPTGPPRTQQRR